METQQLVDVGKQMNLEGEELRKFVLAEQALARDEIIRIREDKKEEAVRIAGKEEAVRIAAKEEAVRIAAMEEAERIRQHEKEMFHLQIEADRIRRRLLQLEKIWTTAEEMQHEKVEKTAEEMQHEKVEKTAEEVQHEKVEKTAEEEVQHDEVGKTADEEMQHVNVMKTAEEKMQLEKATTDSEASHYEVTQIKSEGDGFNVELNTCADIAESAQVGHATKDGENASEQEAEHHKTDEYDGRLMMEQERDDMEHGRAIEEEEFFYREVERQRQIHVEQPALESETRFERRNADGFKTEVTDHHIGQVRRQYLLDPLDMRPSKVPKDRPRFASRRDHDPKRSSFERNGRVDGRRLSPLSKSRRYSSWARKKTCCRDMLRKYVDKEHVMCSVAAILDSVECPELQIEEEPEQGNEYYHDVKIANELVGNPAWELRELLREYKEIFTDVPGLTKLEEHAITLNTTTAIRWKSYPVPFSKVSRY